MNRSDIRRAVERSISRVHRWVLGNLAHLGDQAVRAEVRKEIEQFEAEVRSTQRRAQRAERRLAVAREESDVLRRAVVEEVTRLSETMVAPSPARRPGDRPPSFRYKLGEQRRRALLMEQLWGVAEPIMAVDDKFEGIRFAASLGIAVPRVIVEPSPLADIDFRELPDEFVIKPVDGHSSRGVFPLVRTEADAYRSLLDRGEAMTESEIRRRCAEHDTVMVEELMAEGTAPELRLPVEWRFFAFAGRVGLVMGRSGDGYRSLRRQRFRYFDRSWNDLGIVRLESKHDPEIEVPDRGEEAVAVAEKMAESISRTMVRIDLHVLERGVYFGEITPSPGGSWLLVPEIDRLLGEKWETAEAELHARAVRDGLCNLRWPQS